MAQCLVTADAAFAERHRHAVQHGQPAAEVRGSVEGVDQHDASSGRLRRAAIPAADVPPEGRRGAPARCRPRHSRSRPRRPVGRPPTVHSLAPAADPGGARRRVDDEPTRPRCRVQRPVVKRVRSSRRSPELGAVVGVACHRCRHGAPRR